MKNQIKLIYLLCCFVLFFHSDSYGVNDHIQTCNQLFETALFQKASINLKKAGFSFSKKIKPGDKVNAIINGQTNKYIFLIATPEFVYVSPINKFKIIKIESDLINDFNSINLMKTFIPKIQVGQSCLGNAIINGLKIYNQKPNILLNQFIENEQLTEDVIEKFCPYSGLCNKPSDQQNYRFQLLKELNVNYKLLYNYDLVVKFARKGVPILLDYFAQVSTQLIYFINNKNELLENIVYPSSRYSANGGHSVVIVGTFKHPSINEDILITLDSYQGNIGFVKIRDSNSIVNAIALISN